MTRRLGVAPFIADADRTDAALHYHQLNAVNGARSRRPRRQSQLRLSCVSAISYAFRVAMLDPAPHETRPSSFLTGSRLREATTAAPGHP
jgi:hypothetical protein